MINEILTVHPTTEANWLNENCRTEGLLLRDYFAAKAMQGILSGESNYGAFADLANDSYAIADAMIEARSAHSSK